MERKQALYCALCTAIIAFSLAFAFPAFSPTRVLWYYPLAHEWRFEVKSNGIAMDFYGRNLLATVISTAAFALVFVLLRRRKVTERTLGLMAAWASTALLLSMGLYTYQLVMRHPTPAPLPAWYQPK